MHSHVNVLLLCISDPTINYWCLVDIFSGPYLLVSADGYAFSIMISALHRGGHHEESKQLAKEFESENASYDLVMLNTSLRTYCSTNDMESVMRMLKKMDELNISPDNITFNTLIMYFFNSKVYHLAYKTVEDMHTKGHQLNEVFGSRKSFVSSIMDQTSSITSLLLCPFLIRIITLFIFFALFHLLILYSTWGYSSDFIGQIKWECNKMIGLYGFCSLIG